MKACGERTQLVDRDVGHDFVFDGGAKGVERISVFFCFEFSDVLKFLETSEKP